MAEQTFAIAPQTPARMIWAHQLPDDYGNGTLLIWVAPAENAGDIWLYKDCWYDITAAWLTTPAKAEPPITPEKSNG